MSTLMGFLSNADLLPYALAVIYNTMADYGKKQWTLPADPRYDADLV